MWFRQTRHDRNKASVRPSGRLEENSAFRGLGGPSKARNSGRATDVEGVGKIAVAIMPQSVPLLVATWRDRLARFLTFGARMPMALAGHVGFVGPEPATQSVAVIHRGDIGLPGAAAGRTAYGHTTHAAPPRPIDPDMEIDVDATMPWAFDDRDASAPLPSVAVRIDPAPHGRLAAGHRAAKRLMDVFGASIGLAVCAPLFAVVAFLILITSGRPIFYTQERVGRGGRRFRILKFRSMRADAEGETGPVWATERDARCTPLGDWLRRFNIDELPQLVNVLRGEMSLIGPRPERPVFVARFRERLTGYDSRHSVPAGMTGWAQVHGWRGRTSVRKRLEHDLEYVARWSFWLDLRILLMTVQHLVWGKTQWGRPGRRAGR